METEKTTYLLEAYLDGAVQPAEAAAMVRRLEREPALREMADGLRAQRALRASAWGAMEGTDAERDAVVTRFMAAARRQTMHERRMRAVGWGSAAAAVILLGFGIGWSGRALIEPAVPSGPMVQVAPEQEGYRVAVTDAGGNVIAVQRFGSIEEARRFSQDLHDWQDRQQRLTEGQILLVGDRF